MADSTFGPVDGLFLELRSKRTGVLIGTHYICEVCKKKSVLIKPDKDGNMELPASWSRFYKVTASGRRSGFNTVYCAKCKTCTNREIVEAERARPGIHSRRSDG